MTEPEHIFSLENKTIERSKIPLLRDLLKRDESTVYVVDFSKISDNLKKILRPYIQGLDIVALFLHPASRDVSILRPVQAWNFNPSTTFENYPKEIPLRSAG